MIVWLKCYPRVVRRCQDWGITEIAEVIRPTLVAKQKIPVHPARSMVVEIIQDIVRIPGKSSSSIVCQETWDLLKLNVPLRADPVVESGPRTVASFGGKKEPVVRQHLLRTRDAAISVGPIKEPIHSTRIPRNHIQQSDALLHDTEADSTSETPFRRRISPPPRR